MIQWTTKIVGRRRKEGEMKYRNEVTLGIVTRCMGRGCRGNRDDGENKAMETSGQRRVSNDAERWVEQEDVAWER